MRMDGNQLKTGLRFNEGILRQRRTLMYALGLLALSQVVNLGLSQGVEVRVVALGATLILAGVFAYLLHSYRQLHPAVVLEDGLEIDRRVIPFNEITGVTGPDGSYIVVHYTYHGVQMTDLLGLDPNSNLNLHQLRRELLHKAGLQDAGPVSADAASPA